MATTMTLRRSWLVVGILLVSPLLAQQANPRAPIPDDAARAEALRLAKEVYAQEYVNAKTVEQKKALAETLLRKAGESKDDAAAQFVLLRLARDVAVLAGEADVAMRAVDQIAASYQADGPSMKAELLPKLAASARSPQQRHRVVTHGLALVDEAVSNDEFPTATEMCGRLVSAARNARDSELLQSVTERSQEVARIAKAYAAVTVALGTLERNPTDPAANLAVGRYFCFVKGNWSKGIPMLALGADAKLKSTAVKELKDVKDPAEQTKLGDAWWELAEKEEAAKQRAGYWYQKALPGLTGLAKAAVEKRLEELSEIASGGTRPFQTVPVVATDPRAQSAITSGLKWLVKNQGNDGSWTFKVGPNPGTGQLPCTATSMALLALLRAGHTHLQGEHREAVRRGLSYLRRQIKPVGRGGSLMEAAPGRMYAHGICALALCEAYSRTKDQMLRRPSQATVDFIVYAQDPVGGGWRYQPRQKGDTSVTGWQVSALVTAKEARLRVPDQTFAKASNFFNEVQSNSGANYGYTDPGAGQATTAIGLLCRVYVGWKKDNPAFVRGVKWLSGQGPSRGNMYYNYYATQVMRQMEGEDWVKWKNGMREELVNSQARQGQEQASWYMAKGDHGADVGGRLYCTSMALMVLEFCEYH